MFFIDEQTLRLDVEDIYFLTALSWRGEEENMKARNIGHFTVDEYLELYCSPGAKKIGT